ncbi:hypothetical protein E2562_031852 [Oryza meyeriana var. granulata]|uniref:Uncharacterized protein n=1 Tax=Oryza meyeriana var. granulata TaxID=110450 RepID=A0A6G1C181_9ORYZ|nr:hypothetical protein E2562_031852 [Oryza meyeriana var. granulata]
MIKGARTLLQAPLLHYIFSCNQLLLGTNVHIWRERKVATEEPRLCGTWGWEREVATTDGGGEELRLRQQRKVVMVRCGPWRTAARPHMHLQVLTGSVYVDSKKPPRVVCREEKH